MLLPSSRTAFRVQVPLASPDLEKRVAMAVMALFSLAPGGQDASAVGLALAARVQRRMVRVGLPHKTLNNLKQKSKQTLNKTLNKP